jgi:AMP-binding enzyme
VKHPLGGLGHPKVGVVAVVGMPHPVLGEKVCAFVVPAVTSVPTLSELTGGPAAGSGDALDGIVVPAHRGHEDLGVHRSEIPGHQRTAEDLGRTACETYMVATDDGGASGVVLCTRDF